MQITIEPHQRTLQAPAGSNLLQVLRDGEVPVSYSCTAGRCGVCRCKVTAGEVLEGGLAASAGSEARPRFVLACQTTLTQPCTIEVPPPDEVVLHPARILKATVVGLDDLAHDIKRLRLRSARPLEFSPGQYAQLQFTPDHIRPYSMAGVAGDELLEFHIRQVPEGRVTGYVARALKIGDAVRVSGPMGSAYLRRKHTGPMLCVAGGTGLAPILSILRGAAGAGMANPLHVYFGVRSREDVYGLQWLDELRTHNPQLNVHVVVATGEAAAGQRQGLVTDAIANDWAGLQGWRAYLCGSPPMVEAATQTAVRLGISPEHVHADAFYATPA